MEATGAAEDELGMPSFAVRKLLGGALEAATWRGQEAIAVPIEDLEEIAVIIKALQETIGQDYVLRSALAKIGTIATDAYSKVEAVAPNGTPIESVREAIIRIKEISAS